MNNNPFARKASPVCDNDDDDDDPLYAGFHNMVSSNAISTIVAPTTGVGAAAAAPTMNAPLMNSTTVMPLGTATGPTSMAAGVSSPYHRVGTAEGGRPMTSIRGAGYTSKQRRPLAAYAATLADDVGGAILEEREESSPEYQTRQMDKLVHSLIEESVQALVTHDCVRGLEKAKAAAKQERTLTKFREKHKLHDQISFDLTYAVMFNLASQYEGNGMMTEALSAYNIIVKNRDHPHAGRLRVNMGNIYYRQNKYPQAIKMYRMAMDQIGTLSHVMRDKIRRNIATCFVRLGRFQEAIDHFECIMDSSANDAQAAFNLIVCYYALGDRDKMKQGFIQLLSIMGSESRHTTRSHAPSSSHSNSDSGGGGGALKAKDPLNEYKRNEGKRLLHYVLTSAKLIAAVIEQCVDDGFDWIIERLRSPREYHDNNDDDDDGADTNDTEIKQGFPTVAMELEITKGITCLKRNEIPKAIEVFRAVERKDVGLIDQAATNLSFLHYLHGDYKQASKYAQMATKADRYNAKALVNKANVLVVEERLDEARELYLEAIGVEADCIEAIYNLGVVNKRVGNFEDALQAFKKMHRISPKDPQVIYQIASLYDMLGDATSAIEWFKILQGIIPTDPNVLSRLGSLYHKQQDDNAAYHNYSDCYNAFPCDMKVISWLGVWFVTNQMYERAIHFFERASELEPDESKWKLMIASCYRRLRSFAQALSIYKAVHTQDPENLECLRYLVELTEEFNDPDHDTYLQLYEQQRELHEHRTRYAAAAAAAPVEVAAMDDVDANDQNIEHRGNDDDSGGGGENVSHTANAVSIDASLVSRVADKEIRTMKQTGASSGINDDDDMWGDDADDLLPI